MLKGIKKPFQMLQVGHLYLNCFHSLWNALDCANLYSPKSFPGMVCEIAEVRNSCQSTTLLHRAKKLN